ncbi:hypothetical protein JYT86_00590 [bacterium AH-315-N03]|nr:hypothetical protein [bacterium AH-315-N03]
MKLEEKEALRGEVSALDIQTAVVDGINIYLRDVLEPHGLINEQAQADPDGSKKYRIALRVALCYLGTVKDLNWRKPDPWP